MRVPSRFTPVIRWAIAPLGGALLMAALQGDAWACSYPPNGFFPPAGEDGADVPVLGSVEVVSVSVERGRGPVCDATGCSSTSCDDTGTLRFELSPEAGRDPRVGHRIELVGGTPPTGIGQFPLTVSADGDELRLRWIDGAVDRQDPLDFTVTIAEIDAFGNSGPAPSEVRVLDDGEPESERGGRAGGGALGWTTPFALFALASRRRRRVTPAAPRRP